MNKNTLGIFTEPGTIRFERLFPGPIEHVWNYLTDPTKRGTWLASGDMDLQTGGDVQLIFNNEKLTTHREDPPEKYKEYTGESYLHGKITQLKSPELLSYTWGEPSAADSEVTFELTPKDDQVQLILTHRRLGDNPDTLTSVAAGWHTHLGILEDKLSGHEPSGFWSVHMKMEEKYIPLLSESFPKSGRASVKR